MSAPGFEVGSLISPRYRVLEVIVAEGGRTTYRAKEALRNRLLYALPLTRAEVDRMQAVRQIEHAHLVPVAEFVPFDAGGAMLLVEDVKGPDLVDYVTTRLEKHRSPVDAVRLLLRIADVLSVMHAAGAVHGFIQPTAVIAEPQDRAGPVVSFTGAHRNAGVYRSPERTADDPPSEADDAWAVAALLYYAITGQPAPSGGIRSFDELAQAGVSDTLLREALLQGLHVNLAERAKSLKRLRRELARWFVAHAGEESMPPSVRSAEPPPLPAVGPARPAAPAPSESPGRAIPATFVPAGSHQQARRRIPMMATLGIVLGLVAAWAVSEFRPTPKPSPPPVVKAPAPKKAPIDLSEIPVTGEKVVATGDQTATCVAGYLPKSSFEQGPDFSWLCSETDPRSGAEKLRTAIVEGAPRLERPNKAMQLMARMSWYEMAAFAVIRSGCCRDAPPLELDQNPKCDAMDSALQDIGRLVVSGEDYEEALKSFRQIIYCEVKSRRGSFYRRAKGLGGGEDTAFLELVRPLKQP